MDKKSRRILLLMAALAAAAIIYYLVILPAREKEQELAEDEAELEKKRAKTQTVVAQAVTQKADAAERLAELEREEFRAKANTLEDKLIATASRMGRRWEKNTRDTCWFKNSDSCTRDLKKRQTDRHGPGHFLGLAVSHFKQNRDDEIPGDLQLTFDANNGKVLISSPSVNADQEFTYEYKVNFR